MVSTRGSRSKFSVGEKVLCYEPDPTKARVLYDSKVLKVLVKTNKAGRKAVEYRIHFQGWNSSWDRYVSEDYILKHTDENWRLQRELAEKAQLRPGAYLYRRDRKDQKLNKDPQKICCYTGEKDSQQSTSASATVSRGDSISSYSTYSVETESNQNHKKIFTADTSEAGKESVMEDTNIHNALNDECGTQAECTEYSEERHENKDNGVSDTNIHNAHNDECGTQAECSEERHENMSHGVSGSVDAQDSAEKDRNNEQQHDDIGSQDIIDDREVGNNVQGDNHELTDDFSQTENGAVEHLEESNFTCEISDVMKELLEMDNDLIKSRNKIIHLPARPNVVTILESYVREYAVNQICEAPRKPRRKYRRHQKNQNGHIDMDQVNRSVNICKEVADGVRVYFDFMLSGLLLYNEEREQYEYSRHMFVAKQLDSRLNTKSPKKKEAAESSQPPGCSLPCEQSTCAEEVVEFDDRMEKPNFKKGSRSQHVTYSGGKVYTVGTVSTGNSSEETKNCKGICNANKQPCLPSVSAKEGAISAFHDNLSSIKSVSSKHLSQNVVSNVSSAERMNPKDCHTSLKFLLPHLLDWQLVPESLYTEKPVMPSLVYGAVHLARLLVILPSLLLNTKIPAKKQKIVLWHLQMILRYLEQNRDWFAENVYEDNCT